ncbi:MAG: D-2-hydroxyacid dehydrogenase [Lachnospiraceae bacterium]|nr:D-2-hydroxyacid dehydrogenase [Lachnospiraceae bacterium]
MKIVALEIKNIGEDISTDMFKEFGEFETYLNSKPEEMPERCKGADVIIVNKLPVNEETIGDIDTLKVVLITATGFDNLDMPYLKSRGIKVCNVKGYSTDSVAQHTFALLFYVYEKLRSYDDFVKSGDYSKYDIFTCFDEPFNELTGKVWGIVGLGAIGRRVAKIATAFGCDVVYYSTSGKNSNNDYEQVDFDKLLEISDIISIHSPLNEKTKYLFNAETFKKMKKSAVLINVGRGPIINDRDLTDALKNDEIAAAALDVLEKEPMAADSPYFEITDSRKLFITPHIAWATKEARERLMMETYRNLKAIVEDAEPRNRLDLM